LIKINDEGRLTKVNKTTMIINAKETKTINKRIDYLTEMRKKRKDKMKVNGH